MSWHEYMESKRIQELDVPFYSLIMEALRRADTVNFRTLSNAFPEVAEETYARYHAPGGLLPNEERPAEWALKKYGLV